VYNIYHLYYNEYRYQQQPYLTLNTYAILAASGITTVNITTVTNGDYGTPGGFTFWH